MAMSSPASRAAEISSRINPNYLITFYYSALGYTVAYQHSPTLGYEARYNYSQLFDEL